MPSRDSLITAVSFAGPVDRHAVLRIEVVINLQIDLIPVVVIRSALHHADSGIRAAGTLAAGKPSIDPGVQTIWYGESDRPKVIRVRHHRENSSDRARRI